MKPVLETGFFATLGSIAGRFVTLAIRVYQLTISPVLPPSCRFYPSCSDYAMEAVRVHGAGKGSILAMRRVAKCHPLHPGGIDRVPPRAGECSHDHAESLNIQKQEMVAGK